MATYLITGSSRGLGLALVSRLASLPQSEVSAVFATARQDNSPRLRELVDSSSSRVGFVPLDVTDERSATEAVELVDKQLQGRGLDVLINNAGVMPVTRQGLEGMYALVYLFQSASRLINNPGMISIKPSTSMSQGLTVSQELSCLFSGVARGRPSPTCKLRQLMGFILTIPAQPPWDLSGCHPYSNHCQSLPIKSPRPR